MNDVWIFTSNNARLIKVSDEDLYYYKDREDVLVNPSTMSVSGISPHYWKKSGCGIVAMSPEECIERDFDHEINGVDNQVSPQESENIFSEVIGELKNWFDKHPEPVVEAPEVTEVKLEDPVKETELVPQPEKETVSIPIVDIETFTPMSQDDIEHVVTPINWAPCLALGLGILGVIIAIIRHFIK